MCATIFLQSGENKIFILLMYQQHVQALLCKVLIQHNIMYTILLPCQFRKVSKLCACGEPVLCSEFSKAIRAAPIATAAVRSTSWHCTINTGSQARCEVSSIPHHDTGMVLWGLVGYWCHRLWPLMVLNRGPRTSAAVLICSFGEWHNHWVQQDSRH